MVALTAKLRYHGLTVDVRDVVGRHKDVGGIAQSGDLSWPAITKAFPSVYFHWRWSTVLEERGNVAYRKTTEAAYDEILQQLALGQPVLVRTVTPSGFGHWVLAVDGAENDDLLIMDPWDGQMRRFSEKYGQVKDNLYAYATLLGSPNGKANHIPDHIINQVVMSAGHGLYATANGEPKNEIIDKLV
jgi:hypothetical protein